MLEHRIPTRRQPYNDPPTTKRRRQTPSSRPRAAALSAAAPAARPRRSTAVPPLAPGEVRKLRWDGGRRRRKSRCDCLKGWRLSKWVGAKNLPVSRHAKSNAVVQTWSNRSQIMKFGTNTFHLEHLGAMLSRFLSPFRPANRLGWLR